MPFDVSGPVWRERLRSSPFLLLVGFTLVLLLLRIHLFVWGDTWFNLVLGRQVAESGVLTHDRTTAVGWGTPVLDVQWLAHYAFYRIADAVGIAGLVLAGATMVACTVVGGAALALRSGASAGRTLLATLLAFMAIGAQLVLRAQTLAYPFFVLFPAMLWWDARAPRWQTWALVPAAMLWANLHGSVLLAPVFGGALLVARVLDALRTGQPVPWRVTARDAVLAAALAVSILATPYGLSVWRYYAATAGNPVFRDYITEWFPIWANTEIGPIALLLIVLLTLARGCRASDSFPLLVLGGLCIMLVSSVRHATPLALACLVLLPRLLDAALGSMYPLDFSGISPPLGRAVVMVTAVGFVVGVPLLAGKDNPHPGAESLEARVAAFSARQCLLVDEQRADRLIWYFPQLTGRISHSVRVETIPLELLTTLGTAYAFPDTPAARALWRSYPLVALDHRMHAPVIEVLSRDTQFELLGQEGPLFVFRNRLGATLSDACARYAAAPHG